MELIVLSAVGTTTMLLSELCGLMRGHLARGRRATSRARWLSLKRWAAGSGPCVSGGG